MVKNQIICDGSTGRRCEERGLGDVPLRSNALIVDAADSERLAAFRSEPLGRPVGGRTGPCV